MLVCARRAPGLCLPWYNPSEGCEVKMALSKLTLIKRVPCFPLITSDALNIGQAGWVSQCKINQSYMKNPRGALQLTKFSL